MGVGGAKAQMREDVNREVLTYLPVKSSYYSWISSLNISFLYITGTVDYTDRKN